MYQFQESLPKLPLPRIEDTLERYLEIVAPLLSDAELAQTKAAAMDFQQGSGPVLQKQLEMIDRSTNTSYLHEFTLNSRLENRLSIPFCQGNAILVSPVLTTEKYSCTRFAATVISHVLKFYLKVKRRELEPDRDIYQKNKPPLCMAQYENLFGVSRIPGIKRDSLQRTKNPEHIVVIRRNVFYALKLIEGEELPTWDAIAQQLDWILENTLAGAPPIGALTTLNRIPWAINRSYMSTLSQENAHSLDLLDSALFVVCLDETIPTDTEAVLRNALYGDGRNRWFDKSIQLIFTASNQLAIHCEHTGLDGYTVSRLIGEVYQDLQHPSVPLLDTAFIQLQPPTQLQWTLDRELQEAIEQASTTAEHLIAQDSIRVLIFKEFGSDFIRQHGLIPDAVVALSLQLAHFRLCGELISTRTMVHTRSFRYGRVESAFAVTPEFVELIRAFSEVTSDEVRYLTLKRAVMAYVWRLFDCKQGEGVYRHLWTLHTLARYQGDVLPDIFLGKAYTEFFSKSGITIVTLPGEMGRELMCGSVWDHYAHDIRYVMEREKISFAVASKRWQTEKFIQILKQSLLELGKLMYQFSEKE
ncbi:choline/carnitine O-acyltransferase [Coleofasciculus sp.]|uniref:choline/carnitine O-acyltransferase n=1 Tax=Coleofasciculus sp. TaxID=3100458 RepID=UPI0039F8DF20